MEKEKILNLIKQVLIKDAQVVFAYVYGSFVTEEVFRDIDIGIYTQRLKSEPPHQG